MANNFSGDANCCAVWRFESGALTSDSKSTNTLVNNNTVAEDTVNYKEGACSADFESGSSQYFSLADASLSAGFPLKNGDTNKKISVTFWMNPESNVGTICSKYSTDGKRSFAVAFALSVANKITMRIGTGSATGTDITHATALSAANWYHVLCSYDDSNGAYVIHITDTDGNIVGVDKTGNIGTGSYIYVGSATWEVGAWNGSNAHYDGVLDEMVVCNDILTPSEADQIAAGTYSTSVVYNASISDGFKFSDAPTAEIAVSASFADGIKLSDVPSSVVIISSSISDGIKFSDTPSSEINIGQTISDGIKLSDSPSASVSLALSITDGIKFSDTPSANVQISASISDGFKMTDAPSLSLENLGAVMNFETKNKSYNFSTKSKAYNFETIEKTYNFETKNS